MIATLPNNTTGRRLFECHVLAIPPCCPVSHNPRPGSTLTICYRANEQVLEIASLTAYIHRFVGGLRDAQGGYEVRDMEGMLCRVAAECANCLGVYVKVTGRLQVLPRQQMLIIARGYLQDESGAV